MNIFTDFYKKTKPGSSSATDSSNSSSGKTVSSQPVPQVSHSAEVLQVATQPGASHVPQYQVPHMKSKPATTQSWLYENPPSGGHFSSSTSYESQLQPTEMFQDANFLQFVQSDEDLFPLESATVHFQSQQGTGVYSQPQVGPSSSYALRSGSSAMLPAPISDTPPLQPPIIPTTLPPNPYNQSPF